MYQDSGALWDDAGAVQKWFGRFTLAGVPGLHDTPRAGAPAKYSPELQGRILAQLELAPPASYARWDGALLERALGVHRKAIWKVLKKEGSSLARKALDGASFNSIEQLNESLAAFIKDYNQAPKPFKWRKREVKGFQLRNTAKNLRD